MEGGGQRSIEQGTSAATDFIHLTSIDSSFSLTHLDWCQKQEEVLHRQEGLSFVSLRSRILFPK